MEGATGFKLLTLQHDISVPSSGRSCHNVFVERERDENNDRQDIDYCAYSTHRFRTFESPNRLLEFDFQRTKLCPI